MFQLEQNAPAVKRISCFSQSLVGIRCLRAKPEADAGRWCSMRDVVVVSAEYGHWTLFIEFSGYGSALL